jgi:hypothetical protein
MTRMPFPEEVSVADAMAFEAWPEEQKRVARAGIALGAYIAERESEARKEGFDAGKAAGLAETNPHGALMLNVVGKPTMHELLDRLQLFRQHLATYDTRYNTLGEILADFAKALEESR